KPFLRIFSLFSVRYVLDFCRVVCWIVENGRVNANRASQVVKMWTNSRPMEAASWVSELPAGDVRDSAVASMVAELQFSDPSSAQEWAATIENEILREQVLKNF
ncbi:hypothetical protein, partial [Roseibacillus ishigakijimensis]